MSENRKPSLTLLTTEEVDELRALIDRLKDEREQLLTACESALAIGMFTLCEHDKDPCPDDNECRVCQIVRILATAIRTAKGEK